MALTLTTNQLKLDNPAVTEPYFSTDLFANYFLDDLIFNNENIDLYMGAGAGIHTLQGQSAASFNVTGGFRYWVSEKAAISLQTIGKINTAVSGLQKSRGFMKRTMIKTRQFRRIIRRRPPPGAPGNGHSRHCQ